MKLFKSMRLPVGALAGAILAATLGAASASDPTLTDFGYRNRNTNSSMPLLVVIINFTNNGNPFRVNGTLVGTNREFATNYFSNWFFSETNQPFSVKSYFNEVSHNRFSWTPAPAVFVTLGSNCTWAAYDALPSGDPDVLYSSNIVRQALMSGQVDFSSYDTNHDGMVTDRELTITEISNDTTFGGGMRWAGTVPGSGIQYRGAISIDRYDWGANVVCHELVHMIQEFTGIVAIDIYGERCLSDHLTVMSCETDRVGLDPWHKLQFGWTEPRIVSMREGGRFVVPAAQMLVSNAPLIVYDPSGVNGVNEFFIAEYRAKDLEGVTNHYDSNVTGNGMAVWHIRQDADKHPLHYVPAAMPDAEHDWARCRFCQQLYSFATGTGRCPSTNTTHMAADYQNDFVLAKDDPDALGVSNWVRCSKCESLYYEPSQAQSHCAAGGTHAPTSGIYTVPVEGDRDTMGQRGYHQCTNCQVLFREAALSSLVCAAGGTHQYDTNSGLVFAVTTTGAFAMMSEGAPTLIRGASGLFGSSTDTPRLRWYLGDQTFCRLEVEPFTAGSSNIVIHVLGELTNWVSFPYLGTERGTFTQPWNTFAEGSANSPHGGIVNIKTGRTSERGHFTRRIKVAAYGGSVTLGSP